jgi:hypothetical protein
VSVCRFGAGGITRRLEDLADRGGTGPVAGLDHLALDPPIPPGAVLGGEALDQRGDLGADGRSSGAVGVGPSLSDQAAVPPQDGARRDQPVRPQPCGRVPDQRGQHRSAGPVQARLGLGAAQHGDLVP